MNQQVVEITEENRKIICDYCHRSEIKSVEWGPMYQLGGVTVHYFCLLFSAGLSQNGEDDEGIYGFLPVDIKKELRRGDKLRCKFCKKTRATIGCSTTTCKASYHFPCGEENRCAFQFIDNFESYCARHKEPVLIRTPLNDMECPICFTDIPQGEEPLWPPCCRKRVFHKKCIMLMAKNHGAHFFKCPLCNDKEIFSVAMRKSGVYVPDRDATWEIENAFADHQRTYSRCDAQECKCPFSRDYNSESDSDPWRVVRCGACGASAIHRVCGELKNLTWRCPTCARILSDKRKSNAEAANLSRIQRHNFDAASDDEVGSAFEPSVTRVRDIISQIPPAPVSDTPPIPVAHTSGAVNGLNEVNKRSSISDEDSSSSDEEIAEDDDDDDLSDSSSADGEDKMVPVFISPEAREKLAERRRREEMNSQTLSSAESGSGNDTASRGNILNPLRTVSPTTTTIPIQPTLPSLSRDSLIKTKFQNAVERVSIRTPEILTEAKNSINIQIFDNNEDSKEKRSPIIEEERDDAIQILSCKSLKETKIIETVELDDEDSSDEIEVISEKIAVVPKTKSSTFIEIVNTAHGNVSKPAAVPYIRPSVNISNAFLSMIREQKRRKAENTCQIASHDSSGKSGPGGEIQTIDLDLDSDDESTRSKGESSSTKKRERLSRSPSPNDHTLDQSSQTKRART